MDSEILQIDTGLSGQRLDRYWMRLVCAGRAAEGLRARWQQQLAFIQQTIGFSYIRFHGIFHDEMMVYTRLDDGRVIYNFEYVDELFDFLLSVEVKPFLELGFMPEDLRSSDAQCFFWKGNISPPTDYEAWAELVGRLITHCIDRYGIDEVRSWYFEVWNEPNLYEYFWRATQEEYFRLYEVTARRIKTIDQGLRVGGPSTSNFSKGEGPWIRDFLSFCESEGLPVDFISSHPYPNHWPVNPATGKREVAYRAPGALRDDTSWLREVLDASAFRGAEIHLTEWNSSFVPWDQVHDTAFMGPFVVQNAIESIGNTDSLGFWTFTDIFEETKAGYGPYHGGFGMLTAQGIPKSSYHGFAFLSRLSDERISEGDDYIITRNEEGYRILLWNYAHPRREYMVRGQYDEGLEDIYGAFTQKAPKTFELQVLHDDTGLYDFEIHRVDREHGCGYDLWRDSLGSPQYMNERQLQSLREGSMPSITKIESHPGSESLKIDPLAPHALVLIIMTRRVEA